jgi:endonuclease/exonuclease/phosphatase family metal-dependent hydrolase
MINQPVVPENRLKHFTLMTYNVHSCIGVDGMASPERIAEILALYEVDIICLQELDSNLLRSGKSDQAREIAHRLKMDFHFHPSLKVEEGEYGNAVLSRFPSRVVRAAALPMLPGRTLREQRGALWIVIDINGMRLNVFNTHLGLSHAERLAQTEALLGPEWLGHPQCRVPVILCGDLNTAPLFGVYRRFARVLWDASRALGWGRGRTWPSGFPFMRLDHVFVSRDFIVEKVMVPRTKLTRIASDHLPLIVRLRLAGEGFGAHGTENTETGQKLPGSI